MYHCETRVAYGELINDSEFCQMWKYREKFFAFENFCLQVFSILSYLFVLWWNGKNAWKKRLEILWKCAHLHESINKLVVNSHEIVYNLLSMEVNKWLNSVKLSACHLPPLNTIYYETWSKLFMHASSVKALANRLLYLTIKMHAHDVTCARINDSMTNRYFHAHVA